MSVNIILHTGGSWCVVNGVIEYIPLLCSRHSISLSLKSTYSKLVNYLAKNYGLDAKREFHLSYKNSSYPYPINITNDFDLTTYLKVVLSGSNFMFPLFLVQEKDVSSSTMNVLPSQPLFVENETNNQWENTFDLNEPCFENQFEDFGLNLPFSKQYDRIGSSHKPPKFEDEDEDEDYNPCLDKDVCRGLGISETTGSEGSDFGGDGDGDGDRDEVEDENPHIFFPPEARPNTLWGMPASMPLPESKCKEKKSVGSKKSLEVVEGQYFRDKKELKLQLGLKCVKECHEFSVTQSTKKRFEAKCSYDGCKWHIRATKVKDNECF